MRPVTPKHLLLLKRSSLKNINEPTSRYFPRTRIQSRKTALNSSAGMASSKGTTEGESVSRKDVGGDVDVDELLRVVSVIGGEDSRGSSSCFEGEKGHIPREIVAREASSHGVSPIDVGGGIKKRRCGTIYLAGMTVPRGYCASSMSQL